MLFYLCTALTFHMLPLVALLYKIIIFNSLIIEWPNTKKVLSAFLGIIIILAQLSTFFSWGGVGGVYSGKCIMPGLVGKLLKQAPTI